MGFRVGVRVGFRVGARVGVRVRVRVRMVASGAPPRTGSKPSERGLAFLTAALTWVRVGVRV